MELASLLLIGSAIAAGVVAAVVRTWALHRRVYSLEDRLAVVEGVLTREVKTRAGQERWKKPDPQAALLSTLTTATPAGRKPNWWEVPIKQ